MPTIFKPPTPPIYDGKKSVFLAGTIDNGNSADWQAEVEQLLTDEEIIILNPRRNDWDASWEQTISNPKFKEQVEWELDGLDRVDAIFMYFAAGSKSPITLLELGLHAASGKVIIVCPNDFWRRGNLEVIAERYGIPLFEKIEAGLQELQVVLGSNKPN
ncbi:MAG: nucleoside 2-deoxyribosyltransferase domain-containing protein [Chloroflexota bacterium]